MSVMVNKFLLKNIQETYPYYYFINDFEKSLTNATIALSYDTQNERLKNNLKVIKDKFLENEKGQDN